MPHRIFITGASGYLGSAIADRLLRAGHEVTGLTRSQEHASALAASGITPVIGDLSRPESYLHVLKNCDVAIHSAAEGGARMAEQDRRALEAIRAAAQDGRVRHLLYTSGVWVLGDTAGRTVDESTPLNPIALVKWRATHEDVAIDLAEFEVRSMVFRPATVYGEARGIIGAMFAEAAKKKIVRVPGTGEQTWGLVHRDDVAEAYLLGLEHGRAGERYLLVDESAFTLRQIAEAIARVTGATVQTWPAEEVLKQLGPFGEALLLSQRATAAKARRDLGWVPRHTSLVNEAEALFREWQSQRATVA
jgi:nucleoside-diphosphate-sugar epimerase